MTQKAARFHSPGEKSGLVIEELANPELVASPKEWLVKASKVGARPRYVPKTDNPRVAEHLDIAKVEKKCPSFRELTKFVRKSFVADLDS